MIQFETPEFLLLAFPLWYVFRRWGRLPGETAWLLAVPAYGLFCSWDVPAAEEGWFWTGVRFVQGYGWAALPVPVFFALRNWARSAGVTNWLRLALVTLCLFGLAGPRWNIGGKGVDVIVVVDRSRSLPKRADKDVVELIDALRDQRAPGDRVAVITFGRKPHTEQGLSATQRTELFGQTVQPDGSDLEAALQRALDLVDGNRPARVLVLSDGEANGPPPDTAARRAREEGVPIDYIGFHRQNVGDVAVRNVTLPETVRANEPFQFRAVIQSDGDASAKVTLQRESLVDGQVVRKQIASQTRTLTSGRNEVAFGDALPTGAGGTYRYRVEVAVEGDPRPQNNRWADEVFVDAGPRLLLLVKDEAAKSGRLARILTHPKNGLPTDVAVADRQPLTKLQLDRYRGVIIENVPAEKFGFLKMSRLAKFVTDRGGGLLMTGGENSFGTGGYFKSPLDEILPVSMELREEHRKLKVAIAVVLDRSGSMRAHVAGGRTKMDLANLGTQECVRMLSRNDMVSVIAVDTSAHVEQPLTPVVGKEAINRKVQAIRSQGGGIFVDVALKAAEKELAKAKKRGVGTRHVILFSDARDTEISGGLGGAARGPAGVIRYVKRMKSDGVTVSVIGLGTEADVHAGLLKDIAAAGGGNAMFTSDARDLPRLFTQDAMNVARNTFLRKDDEHPDGFAARRLKGPFLVGDLGDGPFPNVDGYNLTYLRTRAHTAQAAVVSGDEYKAPWTAFWHRGLGRVAALPIEVDGKHTGAFGEWPQAPDFLLTHARWLLGGDDPRRLFVEIERQGQDAVVTVELDPRNPEGLQSPPKLRVIPPGAEPEDARSPEFTWVDANVLQARFPLDRLGIFRTQLQTGPNRSARGPSISLPYSPEFFPRAGRSGPETLREIARLSGGQERTDVLELLDHSQLPRLPRMVAVLRWVAALLVVVLLVEIAGRRLALWERTWKAEPDDDVGQAFQPAVSGRQECLPHPPRPSWWAEWKRKRAERRRQSREAARPAEAPAVSAAEAAQPSMTHVLEQAKREARRRRRE